MLYFGVFKKIKSILFGPSPSEEEYWTSKDSRGDTRLHTHAYNAQSKIPAWVLTEKNLGITNDIGTPVIQHMLYNNRISDIPESSLTKELFDLRSTTWRGSVLETAVEARNWAQLAALPSRLFETEDGDLTDVGFAVLRNAAMHGWVNAPAGLISSKHLNNEFCGQKSCFRTAASYGTLRGLPLHVLTEENFAVVDFSGTPVFHEMIGLGYLCDLPPECITLANLTLKKERGITAFQSVVVFGEINQLPVGFVDNNLGKILAASPNMLHDLAMMNYLDRLPQGSLAPSDYMRLNDNSDSVLHVMARHGKFRANPSAPLLHANLGTVNGDGDTVYHVAAAHGYLSQLPKELLTADVLALKTSTGETVLSLAVGAASSEYGYDAFIGDLLTVENLQMQKTKSILSRAAQAGRVDRIPISLPVSEEYKWILDVPLPRTNGTWWDAHVEYLNSMKSLTKVEESSELDIF